MHTPSLDLVNYFFIRIFRRFLHMYIYIYIHIHLYFLQRTTNKFKYFHMSLKNSLLAASWLNGTQFIGNQLAWRPVV